MRCPVCGAEHINDVSDCNICGTKNINPTFLNKADAADWQEGIDFAKAVWFLEENHPTMKLLTAEFRGNSIQRTSHQLDIYFGYSDLKDKIADYPSDYNSISWMIDFLVQIYTFPNNYPVSSRKYVKNEIIHYMSLLNSVRGNTSDSRFKHTCNKAVLALLSAEVELSDGNVARAISYYYDFLTNPIISKGVCSFRTNDSYIENEDDIKYVIHNCEELCKLFSLTERASLARITDRLNGGISIINDGSFYMHGMNCGIIGPNDSAESRVFLRGTKKDKCTLEDCDFEGKVLCTGLGFFGVGCENTILTGYDDSFNDTWSIEYRTPECDLKNTFADQGNDIQREIGKILTLFGY